MTENLADVTELSDTQIAAEGTATKKRGRKKSAGQIWLQEAVRPEMKLVKRGAMLQGLSEIMWIPQAALLALAIAGLIDPHGPGLDPFYAAASTLFLAVIRHVLRVKGGEIAVRAASKARHRLEISLLSNLTDLSPAHELPASGKIASIAVEHIQAIGPYLGRFLPIQARLSLVPLALVSSVAYVSWFAALCLLVFGPLVPVFMAIVGIRAKKASERQLGVLADMSGFLLDRLRGMETLRLFGAVKRSEDDIRKLGGEFRLSTMRVLRIAFLSSTALELFSAAAIAITAIYVGFSLLGDWAFGAYGSPLTLAGGLFMLMIVPEYFSPLRAFAAAYHDRAAGIAAADHIVELQKQLESDSKHEVVGADIDVVPLPVSGALTIKNLRVTRGGRTILSDVSLSISEPELIVIKGPSGTGKSSLMDCILGFLPAELGQISYGGLPLSSYGLTNWQQSISVLSQNPELFHGTLRANLRRADKSADDAQLTEALKLAAVDELLCKIPNGLSGPIGEDGKGLSLGERRRFALARAALRKDARLIIADEPTADLDGATAQKVVTALKTLAHNKPVLVATHDPRVVSSADRVLTLKEGVLVELSEREGEQQ
ncbi:ATP-binding/permease protein CydD [Pseudovibrio axinellae]|uniref:ATP-binding/permease protein CydD n=1 Tax=Pseudovibrio axinellae TaxID=989403 RepID=A0A166AGP2_9HYPH|nr:thiol reductant ABC exporter subunit CydD [Pseudovibrio axinellae]KZL21045.1 ATP-binding/permease protein CydD [Pseudovibrio axinellae]SEP77672.1 ATP-binding cassette, subfamily C, CydD [Pseudovibrio axinellae]